MNDDTLKYIECPICLEIYKKPRILTNCGHTFCSRCIIEYISNPSILNKNPLVIECFVCKKKTQINNIESLKLNYTLISIVEHIKKQVCIKTLISTENSNLNDINDRYSDDIEPKCCNTRLCNSLIHCMNRRDEQ